MRITDVRLRRIEGVLPTGEDVWEERLARPIDIYPEYRRDNDFEGGVQLVDGFHITTFFLEVETDQGVTGRAGPIPEGVAFIIARSLRKLLLGQDPIAGEKLWDQMHRSLIHGRQGEAMLAISAVDCALWDIKGLWLDQPVYRLLGGPTRDEIPAYASMLGFSVLDEQRVQNRALEYKELGFPAQKWFFRHGPMSGHDGMRQNVNLVRTVREAVGEDYDLMFDCWQAMDVHYAAELADRIKEFKPRWLEEAVMPDRVGSYSELKRRTSIPLAGAEHEYTRWGMKRFVDANALDVLQPDIYWCGGLSETLKIAAYATTHDLTVIPHGHSATATLHFSLTQSPIHTPYQEHLVTWNRIHQYFLENPVTPANGQLTLPTASGLGMTLDEAKIHREEVVFT
ncbi:L-lyxonate dehydratase [Arthrobacter tumbae]|uniref:enolase C-terminal domain-like protein n=1 Tax=Arthrobacter tumbae TaxID=163874 RepID=UPI00195E2A8A|nr:enolase C-terminal domain-like protein [Arthrobacter tumbae]MBM7781756.1 L-alanine-DL-glutamate epimerase-like enolase superfamily enzyme [Arthrobacter tumbae]